MDFTSVNPHYSGTYTLDRPKDLQYLQYRPRSNKEISVEELDRSIPNRALGRNSPPRVDPSGSNVLRFTTSRGGVRSRCVTLTDWRVSGVTPAPLDGKHSTGLFDLL